MSTSASAAAGVLRSEDRLDSIASRLVEGSASKEEVVSMLSEIRARGLEASDLKSLGRGFRRATVPVGTRYPAVADLCGTGGGTVRTFNISTVASFVVAGAGVPVAKHGNRSNAGRCGSADLMEALGADLSLAPRECGRVLDSVGFGFFFAQSCNPAMRNASAARKEVGGATVFNVLGPLLNPVSARRRQLIGVYDRPLLDVVAESLDDLGIERGLVVHGSPGMDEVSILGPTEAVLVERGSIDRLTIDPRELGIAPGTAEEIVDRRPAESARLALDILSGAERGSPRDAVVLNAGSCLMAFGCSSTIMDGMELAERALDSGRALGTMRKFAAASRLASERRKDA